jgi:hypothetical protein
MRALAAVQPPTRVLAAGAAALTEKAARGASIAACPPSPAAGQKTPAGNAGTSVSVTCALERLRSAPAIPADTDPWAWSCGFYPGSHPRECTSGTAASFDEARLAFESAWRVFLAKRTEADFQAWRDHRDWIARLYAMWERGEKLPSQVPSSLMRCVCGASSRCSVWSTASSGFSAIYASPSGRGRLSFARPPLPYQHIPLQRVRVFRIGFAVPDREL